MGDHDHDHVVKNLLARGWGLFIDEKSQQDCCLSEG